MPIEIVPLLPFTVVPPWDKVGHFAWYAALTLLLMSITRGRSPLAVVIAVAAFGALDEVCQSFVPGRTADLLDFMVNGCAAAVTALLTRKPICAESSAR